MRKQRRWSRLALNRETLRGMTGAELAGVQGGSDAAHTETVAAGVSVPPACPVVRTVVTCPVG